MILLERRGLIASVTRTVLTSFQRVRKVVWAITKPRTTGARGICFDNQGRIILVRHSYVRGWFLPGGAPQNGETLTSALLRELREELGMTMHRSITRVFHVEQRASNKRDQQTIFTVEGVAFEPRLSLEIEAIATFAPGELPQDLHPSTRYKLDRWRFPERNWIEIPAPSED